MIDEIMRKDVVGIVGTVIGMLGVISFVNYIKKKYNTSRKCDNSITVKATLCELEKKKVMLYANKRELLDLLQQITQIKKELVSKMLELDEQLK